MNKTIINMLLALVIFGATTARASEQFSLAQLVDDKGEVITDWVEHDQAIVIQLSKTSTNRKAFTDSIQRQGLHKFQVFLGDSDVTNLFEFKDQHLVFVGGISLPAGEHQLVVHQWLKNGWHQVGQSKLNVMTSSGFKQAQWTQTLDVNINSQLDEKVSGDAIASDRPHYSDVNANIGLASHHQNDKLTIESYINLLSVSNRQQAVQYADRLDQAGKLDVTDYSASLTKGHHKLVFGHTSYGNNPLLIDGLSRRGITWQYQNDNQLTFNGALLSGSDLAGYNNLLGFADYSQQSVNSLGFGVNTFTESRVSVRIEGSYLDAKRLSQNDFGVGEVASSETNQGMGFRFIAQDNQGRFNGDMTLGASRYNNPDDFGLSFGDELVELNVKTAIAHNLNLSYLLVQAWQAPWGSISNITLNANHASADPLYQTLTASVQANVVNRYIGAQYQFGNVNGNLGIQTSRDNLDNLINLLTTKTNNTSFVTNIPLATIISDPKNLIAPSPWLPSVDYSFQKTHQYALTSPDENVSGFDGGSHLPDQLVTAHSLSASWNLESVSFSLQTAHNNQDNRQVGRQASDFVNLQHSSSINWLQDESTSWSFSLSKNKQSDLENGKIQHSNSVSVSYNWQSSEGLSASINYGLSKLYDSLDEADSLATNADIGITKNITKGEWWLPVNGSISLRINYTESESFDRVFDQASQFGSKTAQLGINFSF